MNQNWKLLKSTIKERQGTEYMFYTHTSLKEITPGSYEKLAQ